jgi:hypothetical protein
MTRREEYRQYATECLLLSWQQVDPANKSTLIRMSRSWYQLALEAEPKTTSNVCRTPPANDDIVGEA